MIIKPFLFVFTTFTLFSQAAEDGKANYALYCSACHGANGVGPENNPNPPLAKSEWLQGTPDRAISAVMVGLKGPIEVKGRLYNLIMPPQGAVLSDEKLASILTYVRSSFGNKGKKVSPERVAKVRKQLAGRTEYYTAGELRQKYPISHRYGWPRLKNLTSRLYLGKWEMMPDFSKLEPAAFEEEPRNLVDVYHSGGLKKEFGMIWEGELITKKEGDYNAIIDASDGARLFINDQLVVEVEGVGPRGKERARRRRFRMGKGSNKLRLEYFNNQGDPGLTFMMQGPTGKVWLSESRLQVIDSAPPIPLVAEKGSAIIYRNFIDGARPKAIAVGYDGGVNHAFSIGHLGLDLVWQGDFMDGGLHWTNRGKGNAKPKGTDVVKLLKGPAFATLLDEKQAWPGRDKTGLKENFGGYSLDKNGLPSFRYTVEGLQVQEHASFSSAAGKRQLVRKITFEGTPPPKLHMALVNGAEVISKEEGVFQVDDKISLTVSGATPMLRTGEGADLVMPVVSPSSLTITYTWN